MLNFHCIRTETLKIFDNQYNLVRVIENYGYNDQRCKSETQIVHVYCGIVISQSDIMPTVLNNGTFQ